jgi:hypothetical protein
MALGGFFYQWCRSILVFVSLVFVLIENIKYV